MDPMIFKVLASVFGLAIGIIGYFVNKMITDQKKETQDMKESIKDIEKEVKELQIQLASNSSTTREKLESISEKLCALAGIKKK